MAKVREIARNFSGFAVLRCPWIAPLRQSQRRSRVDRSSEAGRGMIGGSDAAPVRAVSAQTTRTADEEC